MGQPESPGGGSVADRLWWYRDARQPDPPVVPDRRRALRRERTRDALACLALSTLWFRVPIAGSVPLLFALALVFIFTSLGLGLFISTVSQTQQQAMMTTFFFMLPSILLSGFIFPIANMPQLIQWVTHVIPLRYFLVIVRGIFLKGNGFAILWPQVAVLVVFGVAILGLSALRFRKRLG